MITQNVNMYPKTPQLGTREVYQLVPVPVSKVPTNTMALAMTDTAKYLHPEIVPESSFAPPNFNFLKLLDIV